MSRLPDASTIVVYIGATVLAALAISLSLAVCYIIFPKPKKQSRGL